MSSTLYINYSDPSFKQMMSQKVFSNRFSEQSQNWWNPTPELGLKPDFRWFKTSKSFSISDIVWLSGDHESFDVPEVPVFFENTSVSFHVDCHNDGEIESFKQIKGWTKSGKSSVSYTLSTRNFVGLTKVPFPNGEYVELMVFPFKLHYWSDFKGIADELNKEFPNWIYSMGDTEHFAQDTSQFNEKFLLMWWKQYQTYVENFEKSIQTILNEPHSRLVSRVQKVKVEQITNRVGIKTAERIKRDIQSGVNKKYSISKKVITKDTPENRFIKFVLKECIRNLKQINNLLNTRFQIEKLEVDLSIKSLSKFLHQAFFKEIGEFRSFKTESLVLQQRIGYSGVYQFWNQLRYYLDIFGDDSRINIRSLAELYEVWCFLHVKKSLVDIGFKELNQSSSKLENKGLYFHMKDGMTNSSRLEYKIDDGVILVNLMHEPIFRQRKPGSKADISSYTTTNKPDILMKVEYLVQGKKKTLVWIFDAKYRVQVYNSKLNNDSSEDDLSGFIVMDSDIDLVPPDALNQMHRYRDVLILHESEQRSRPTVGAFCLYPGFYRSQKNWIKGKQKENGSFVPSPAHEQEFPYARSIFEVGIGAFPLLPGSDNHWFSDFLQKQLLEGEVWRDIAFECSASIDTDPTEGLRSYNIGPT